jgi:hypothetical protein
MTFMARTFTRLAAIAATSLLGLTLNATASTTNLIQNGSFESTTLNSVSSAEGTTSQQLNFNGFTVNGWTNNSNNGTIGYNFLFTSGTATAAGNAGNVSLWNSSNGGVNTIPASPDGGSFLGMDGAYQQATVSQTVNNLTVGATYLLSFYYAGAQQSGFTGQTTEGFTVGFGSQTYNTPILTDANHGFTGWTSQSVAFTATSTSQTLSFLADGTPGGEPPFSLLDGVSLVQVTPEPSTLALLGSGILAVGGLVRRRRSMSS